MLADLAQRLAGVAGPKSWTAQRRCHLDRRAQTDLNLARLADHAPAYQIPGTFLAYYAAAVNDSLEPWYIFEGAEEAADWLETVCELYPTRSLIPFARDDVSGDYFACLDGSDVTGDPKVHLVHTFASAGWEDRGNVQVLWLSWLKLATTTPTICGVWPKTRPMKRNLP